MKSSYYQSDRLNGRFPAPDSAKREQYINTGLEWIKARYKEIAANREIFSYILAGVAALLFNWMMYSVFVLFLPMALANFFSWSITMAFAFFTNKVYVFCSRDFSRRRVLKEAVCFLTARSVTGVLEIVMQPQLYALGMTKALLGVEGLQAKVTTCLILSVVNYFCTKLWVFRTGEKRIKSV